MSTDIRTRRMGRIAALIVTVSVCAAACGLSPTAKSTLGASGSGAGGSSTSQDSSSGNGTDTTQSGGGTSDQSDSGTGTETGSGPTTPDSSATQGSSSSGDSTTSTNSAATGTGNAVTPSGTGTGTGPATSSGTASTGPSGTASSKSSQGSTSTKSSSKGGNGSTTASAAPASANCSTAGGNATGINASSINIGLHAPLTGTGTPFPNNSFIAGSKLWWNSAAHNICGRKVNVDFQDDMYTPAGANTVCSQFAKTDFLAVGGAGTDQIQACATNPGIDSTGTPYLSAGVTENGLTSLNNYFAVSLTYRQQGAMIVKMAQAGGYATPKAASTGGQWAIVTAKTDNFNDATTGITAALDAAGITYKVFRIDQGGSNYDAAATSMGQTLALDGYKTVYTLTAPGWWVFQVGGYYKQDPTGGVSWVGPGVSFTDFIVAQLACSTSSNGVNGHAFYLAPNPGLDHATADFKAAASAANVAPDDITWGLWGLSELLYDALLKTAPGGLTRQNFINTVAHSTLGGGVDPQAVYNGSHFGGTGAWEQKIDCGVQEPGQNQNGTWDTVGSNYLTP